MALARPRSEDDSPDGAYPELTRVDAEYRRYRFGGEGPVTGGTIFVDYAGVRYLWEPETNAMRDEGEATLLDDQNRPVA